MIRTVEAVINEQGEVKLLGQVSVSGPRRALVTILDEAPNESSLEVSLLSEAGLAEDWNRPEEDAAWSYLQSEK